LTADEKNSLETKLTSFEASTTAEIAVVTVPTIGDQDTIEDYAVSLFKEWGIGKKGKDNGVLVLVVVDDHLMRIEVGYGLEGDLTDAKASDIIYYLMKPAFKQNDFYGGLDAATTAIIQTVGGESTDELDAAVAESNKPQLFEYIFDGIFGLFAFGFIFLWFASMFARSKSWWGGGIAGVVVSGIAWYIFGSLTIAGIALLILVPCGLLLDFLISRAYQKSVKNGNKNPWWAGGGRGGSGGFGGSSSSGGFGGFGGGSSASFSAFSLRLPAFAT
jgi:uncharacterized protein